MTIEAWLQAPSPTPSGAACPSSSRCSKRWRSRRRALRAADFNDGADAIGHESR